MPCSAAAWMCDGSSRRASSPAYRRGCSVLTRPSMISGKPVKSPIERIVSPTAPSSVAVPPVETSSTPRSARPCAKSMIPRLSETDSRARRICTVPGAVNAWDVSRGPAMRRGYRTSTDALAALVGIARVLDEAVVARSAVDLVLAAAERDDEIGAAAGGEHVGPEAAVELVVAGSAVEQVAAATALQ